MSSYWITAHFNQYIRRAKNHSQRESTVKSETDYDKYTGRIKFMSGVVESAVWIF